MEASGIERTNMMTKLTAAKQELKKAHATANDLGHKCLVLEKKGKVQDDMEESLRAEFELAKQKISGLRRDIEALKFEQDAQDAEFVSYRVAHGFCNERRQELVDWIEALVDRNKQLEEANTVFKRVLDRKRKAGGDEKHFLPAEKKPKPQ
jgi:hypothetical protein